MTQMPSYVEPCKPKKQYNFYSSLLPILLSIFTYILIFYVLDVSPSTILNDTKILFFICNALIIIIAADYGAFTDKENHDFYGEYKAVRENYRSEILGYGVSLTEEIKNREKQEESVEAKDVPEKSVLVISENQPRSVEVDKNEPRSAQNIHVTDVKGETCNARKLVRPKPYGRSKSDKVRRSMINTERSHQEEIRHRSKSYDRSKSDGSKWMVVHKAEAAEEKWENVREESEEFSKMTNEELNRRVEDFIQRFNRDSKRLI